LIIGLSNSIFEIIAGFAAFGVAGFLNLDPDVDKLGTFTLGFFTYRSRSDPWRFVSRTLNNLAPFWGVFFFLTLFLLGIDSGTFIFI
jgi:solute carrier family 6 GABA transporter-like protein 1